MTVKLELHSLASRAAMLITAVFCVAGFIGLALTHFVASVMADPQVQLDTATIEAAAEYFPNSAWVQARMAARLIESGIDETQSHERAATASVRHAARAVSLAPSNYEFRILLAAARELNGDLAEAEAELRAALALAPHHVEVHWRLANLLLRAEKPDQALDEFRAVAAADQSRLPAVLSLVWQAADGRLDALHSVTGESPKARLALAGFLVQQNRTDDAVAVFKSIDARARRELVEESGRLIDQLLAADRIEIAAALWRECAGHDAPDQPEAMWNGGFETPIERGLAQFDWRLGESGYARIGMSAQARTGERALKLAYLGRETTRLGDEIRQMVAVRPGASYRLECYARAENLVTPDGPQIVVTPLNSKTPIAATAVVAAGSHDWQLLSLDFVAPADARALLVSVRQTPQFSYVEPTKGTVWFDDFSLKELP
jgi:tetratricopeptide (TPR) repeat protein